MPGASFLERKAPFLSRIFSKSGSKLDVDKTPLNKGKETKDGPLRMETRRDTATTAFWGNGLAIDLTSMKGYDEASAISADGETGKNNKEDKNQVTYFDFTQSREMSLRRELKNGRTSGTDDTIRCASQNNYKSNNIAVASVPRPTIGSQMPRRTQELVNVPELNGISPPASSSTNRSNKALEGACGKHYDPSTVRFFYGKRWADGMCDAMGKPLSILMCAVPCCWPVTLSTASVRARPLIYGCGSRYLQITDPLRMRCLVFFFAFLSFLFIGGIFCITMSVLGYVPSELRTQEWIGPVIFLVGIPGPFLWGMTHVAIRNRYRINETACSTFSKAVICPCLFPLRVKRHVDQAQGFRKPKGILLEALWATNMQQEVAIEQEQMENA